MRKILLFTVILLSALLISMLSGNQVISDDNGAPAMVTGSPADGQTCNKSNCHTGNPVTPTPGLITSNIPASGYIPGNTYTISATLTQAGGTCWGFEISPQSITGTLLGTPVITNAANTKIVSTKWVTHQLAGTTGANTKTWMFDWIAPAAGTGLVTFYGAFNICNDNNSRTGDFIHTSTLDVNEFVSSSGELSEEENGFHIYPNPVMEHAQFSAYFKLPSDIKITLYNLNGQVIKILSDEKDIAGSYIYDFSRSGMNAGVYHVSMESAGQRSLRKIVLL
jgi:hypothetical protein